MSIGVHKNLYFHPKSTNLCLERRGHKATIMVCRNKRSGNRSGMKGVARTQQAKRQRRESFSVVKNSSTIKNGIEQHGEKKRRQKIQGTVV